MLCPLLVSAQSTRISGQAPDYIGGQVLLYIEEDALSQKEIVVQSTEVDESGEFALDLDLTETSPVRISIDHVSGNMVVQPGVRYQVFFPPLQNEQVRSFSGTTTVDLVFIELSPNDVNAVLSNLNYAVDSFMVANVALIGKPAFKNKLGEFEQALNNQYATYDDPYIQTHKKYTLALTEFSSRAYSRLDLYERHLENIALEPHLTFFDFLRTYFQRYFQQFEANYGTDQVLPALKSENPGVALLELMEQDYLVRQDTLREMVAIHGLMEIYHGEYPRDRVVDALDYIAKNGQTGFNKQAARNAVQLLTATEVGYEAPEITLFNQYNEKVSLDQFQGKYVYLEFMSTWCTDCQREQTILPDLIADYGDVTEVVTVVVDSEADAYQQYISSHPEYEWDILFDPSGYEVRNAYGVMALPTYFLINPEGMLVLSPASAPTDGIVENLYPILQKAQEAQKLKVGEK